MEPEEAVIESFTESTADDAPTEEAATQPEGVLVIKNTDEDGNIFTEIVPVGDVRMTEVQTILELGVLRWRSQIGLAS
jgi:hypothetical protein